MKIKIVRKIKMSMCGLPLADLKVGKPLIIHHLISKKIESRISGETMHRTLMTILLTIARTLNLTIIQMDLQVEFMHNSQGMMCKDFHNFGSMVMEVVLKNGMCSKSLPTIHTIRLISIKG